MDVTKPYKFIGSFRSAFMCAGWQDTRRRPDPSGTRTQARAPYRRAVWGPFGLVPAGIGQGSSIFVNGPEIGDFGGMPGTLG